MSQRLLFVIDSLSRFGATRQLDLLTRELASDFDVHVAVLSVAEELPWTHDERRCIHFLGVDNRNDTLRSLTRSGFRLRKLVKKLEPSIVHSWCHVAQRVALSATHDIDSVSHFATEMYIRPSSNMTLEAIDRRLGMPVKQFVVTHDEIKKSLANIGYPENRISTIPSAIDHSVKGNGEVRDSARRKLIQLGGFGDHVQIAGAVAPLVPRSRLKDLIWATDLLTCIRDDVHFFIFGQGSQRQRLERFAFQTEAGHHVHFIDAEINAIELIPGLDFFWHSHLNEPLPSALCHAMQNEVPVVSVYGPGTSELFTHQESGFATNFGARDEFARWTKFLLELTEQGKQLAEQGRASLAGKFTAESMAGAYRELYAKS